MNNKFFSVFFSRFFCGLIIFTIFSFNFFGESMTLAEAQVSREKFVEFSKKQIGKKYEYGAIGPDIFDCSGLIYYSAKESINVKLPRTVKAIYNDVRIVPDDKKEIGDLVFFKISSNGTISHVGIYIGSEKFITSVDDKTGGKEDSQGGVSIFSLTDEYWKSKYIAVGQFLPSGKSQAEKETTAQVQEENKTEEKNVKKNKVSKQTDKSTLVSSSPLISASASTSADFLLDASVYFDWSLLSPRQFVFRYRGVDALLHVRYTGWALEPGIGVDFRYNYGLDTIQLPVVVSMTLNDFIRVYGGPVFTFNDVSLIDTDKQIKASIFPGIVGVSFTTPSYNFGRFALKGVQDVSYTIYNNVDGATLSFMESMAAGFVMYTGIKIEFPLSVFKK